MPTSSIAGLKKERGLVDLDTTLSLRKPEVQVVVDREAASDLGVPVGTIADTLRVLVGGLPVSKFREGDEQYDVWLRAESGKRIDQLRTCTRSRSRRRPSGWSSSPAWPSSTKTAARPRSSGWAASGSSPWWATPRESRWARRSPAPSGS